MKKITEIMKKYQIIAVIVAAIFVVGAISQTNLALQTNNPTNISKDVQGVIVSSDGMPSTEQSAVLMKVETEKITATRGSTIKVPVTFTYDAVSEERTPVTILFPGKTARAILVPPSVSEKYTQEQRIALLNSKTLPPDVIDLYSLTNFVPSAVTLLPSQTRTVDMYIRIPDSWPDEMLNQAVIFNVNHDVVPLITERADGPVSVEVVIVP
ncbi:MAG: hypothetical protein QXU32_11860 [Nitrososphaerales archaeon]